MLINHEENMINPTEYASHERNIENSIQGIQLKARKLLQAIQNGPVSVFGRYRWMEDKNCDSLTYKSWLLKLYQEKKINACD